MYISFSRHVSKLNKEGGQMERVGPSKFSRLNGLAAYQKSGIKIGITINLFRRSLYYMQVLFNVEKCD